VVPGKLTTAESVIPDGEAAFKASWQLRMKKKNDLNAPAASSSLIWLQLRISKT
jgi:hypothetical protein